MQMHQTYRLTGQEDVIAKHVINISQKSLLVVRVATLQQDRNLEAIDDYKMNFRGWYE